jgi:hypothetical protein
MQYNIQYTVQYSTVTIQDSDAILDKLTKQY